MSRPNSDPNPGEKHKDTLITVNNLAMLLKMRGKLEEAERLYSRVLAVREAALGPKHPSTLSTMNVMAVVLQDRGKLE